MKRILTLLLIVVILSFVLISCTSNYDDQLNVDEPWVLISYSGDKYRIHQKVLYNTETELTYIYDYRWAHENGIYIVTNQTLTIVDKQGNIVGCNITGGE